jgi:hypothetical protein
MAGLPVAGIGTVFYLALLLGMGATKLRRWGRGSVRRIGQRRREELVDTSVVPLKERAGATST